MNERLTLSVPEAAAMLGVSQSWLWPKVLGGELASAKFGRSRRIPVSAVAEFLASRTSGGGA